MFVGDFIKVIQVKAMFGKYSLRPIYPERFFEGSFCHDEVFLYKG